MTAFGEVTEVSRCFPRSLWSRFLTHKTFQEIAEQLLEELPADILQQLGKVAIIVEDDAPREAPNLLGIFRGLPYPDGDPTLPNQIVLYKNNIASEAGNDDQLVREEIRITLLHEIGHFLGLDEDQLEARGLG
jgi:predicted Zn-dependent protease with MMP-like domain